MPEVTQLLVAARGGDRLLTAEHLRDRIRSGAITLEDAKANKLVAMIFSDPIGSAIVVGK